LTILQAVDQRPDAVQLIAPFIVFIARNWICSQNFLECSAAIKYHFWFPWDDVFGVGLIRMACSKDGLVTVERQGGGAAKWEIEVDTLKQELKQAGSDFLEH